MEKLNTSLPEPLFVVKIRDGDNPISHVINNDNGKPWALLIQVASRCWIFDFGNLQFLPCDYSEYSDYRKKFRSIEIKHRPVNTSWGEIITIPHPIKVQEANHRISRAKNKETAELEELKESPLSRFLETERLLSLDEF
jgi:hypothetical protein